MEGGFLALPCQILSFVALVPCLFVDFRLFFFFFLLSYMVQASSKGSAVQPQPQSQVS